MDITVIIPTLTNTIGLKYLLEELAGLDVAVVVIDNHPTRQKTRFFALLQDDHLTYLPQEKNLGFAAAVNLGVQYASTQWLFLVNDDVELGDDLLLKKLVTYAQVHGFVAASPVLKSALGRIENGGYRVLPFGRVELNFDLTQTTDSTLDGLSMASLLIERQTFNALGGLDESFMAYLEDVDFFLRLKKRGGHFGVDPQVSVIHNHMITSSKMNNFKQKQDMANWWRIMLKNYPVAHWVSYLPEIVLERSRNVSGWLKSRKAR